MLKPGELALEYARRKGWQLKQRNLMVEGDSDVRYFELAGNLYKKETGLSLIGSDFNIFSAGPGNLGGTVGIIDEFYTLYNNIKSDYDQNGKVLFRVVALLDNDKAGRSCHKSLLQQHRLLQDNRDIFLLNRVLPRTASEPKALTSQIKKHNSVWSGTDCEIEDLLDNSLIDYFLDEEPDALVKPIETAGQHRHYEWTPNAKGKLYRFVESYAVFNDLTGLVEILKSFRFYLGLPVDGT